MPGSAPWDIRLRRITPDNHTSNLQNQSYWGRYTEIKKVSLNYPNSAVAVIRYDAAASTSLVRRAYEIYGWIVQVPTNYDPIARTYTGIWDGTFKMAWTNNPAWCFLALLTRTRGGLGQYVDVGQVNKWNLYSIAQRCDELVSDGRGGMEPRFTCAVYLADSEDAYTALNNIASIFWGMIYYGAGSVNIAQDAPSTETPALFTNANVMNGMFQYQGSDRSQRHTAALVSWVDPNNGYKSDVEYVPDLQGIARYGLIPVSIAAVGCLSQGQAHRAGKYYLYTNQHDGDVVQFSTGLEAAIAAPGKIIRIADSKRAGRRLGGRILSSTGRDVQLDKAIDLTVGVTYTLYVVNGLGSVETHAVVTPAGSGITSLTIDADWTSQPPRMAIWMVSRSEIQPQLFKVVGIKPKRTDKGISYGYTAIAYNPSKYDFIENDIALEIPNISGLTAIPPTPANPVFVEKAFKQGSNVVSQVNISWDAIANVVAYVVTYQVDQDTPITVQVTSSNLVIAPAKLGTYNFQIVAIAQSGRRSAPLSGTGVADGVSAVPADLTSLSSTILSNKQLQLSWARPTEPSVLYGGRIEVRFSPPAAPMTSFDWADATFLASADGSTQQVIVPLMAGLYALKAITFDGVESANALLLTYDDPDSDGGTGGALSVSVNPGSMQKNFIADYGTSDPARFVAKGGTPPYSHTLSNVSGALFSHTPTTTGPVFTATFSTAAMSRYELYTAVYRDTVTDAAGATATCDIKVGLSYDYQAPPVYCVATDSHLMSGQIAIAAQAGDELCVADESSLFTWIERIDAAETAIQDCVRIVTRSGASLVCSLPAPIPTFDCGLVRAADCIGHLVAVWRGSDADWEVVDAVVPVGGRAVRKISVGNRSFWAGEKPDAFILHHNIKWNA